MEFFNLIDDILSLLNLPIDIDKNRRTRKYAKNIETLNHYDWFKELYNDEKYNWEFSVNKHIRRYLQSNYRVTNMIKSRKSQQKFIRLLNNQAERRKSGLFS